MATVWDEVRADFPAVARAVCLNAAATSPVPRVVTEAVTSFYKDMEEGADRNWSAWTDRREAARASVARLVGAAPEEIAFVANTSTGMNAVADLLADDGAVLSDELEFPAITLPWVHRGVPVHMVPAVEGVIRLEPFSATNAPRAATIVISHVQFANGCRQDLAAFGALKGERRLVVGGSQSVGAFPTDVRANGVDALCSAGHKWLCAGYGAGFVYIARELLSRRPRTIGWMSVERPFHFDNRSYTLLQSQQRLELGTPAFGAIFALGAAADYVLAIGLDAVSERVLWLNRYLTFLLDREGVPVLSPDGDHRSGATLVGMADPGAAALFLAEYGVMVTRKPEGLRVSTHFYNNEADIEAGVRAIKAFLAQRE
jgi:cysteine desulfurase/selenocysteine lyase